MIINPSQMKSGFCYLIGKDAECRHVNCIHINRAIKTASRLHAGQMYGKKPYSYHLDQVARIAAKYTTDKLVLFGAIFHDVLEDTPIDKEELSDIIGEPAANLVWLVTDEPGANRKERKANTYPKIKRNSDAILIKVADRIANINECIKEGNKDLVRMYAKEHHGFESALFDGQLIWEEYRETITRMASKYHIPAKYIIK